VFHSKYFRNALKDPLAEAREGVIKIEDMACKYAQVEKCSVCSPGFTVNVFIHWIYTRNIPNVDNHDDWRAILQDETGISV